MFMFRGIKQRKQPALARTTPLPATAAVRYHHGPRLCAFSAAAATTATTTTSYYCSSSPEVRRSVLARNPSSRSPPATTTTASLSRFEPVVTSEPRPVRTRYLGSCRHSTASTAPARRAYRPRRPGRLRSSFSRWIRWRTQSNSHASAHP